MSILQAEGDQSCAALGPRPAAGGGSLPSG